MEITWEPTMTIRTNDSFLIKTENFMKYFPDKIRLIKIEEKYRAEL